VFYPLHFGKTRIYLKWQDHPKGAFEQGSCDNSTEYMLGYSGRQSMWAGI